MEKQKSILIVDNNPDDVEAIQNIVSPNFQYRIALYGHDALNLAKKYRPQAIVLAMNLPDMDGLALCQLLRQVPGLKKAKIVVITSKSSIDEQMKTIECGADDYLPKPICSKELSKALEKDHLNLDFVDRLMDIREKDFQK